MKQRFLLFTAALCAALAAVSTLTGCREDTIIKSSLTPAVDNIHTFGIGPDFNNGTDTITMSTKTAYEDSVITSTRDGFPIFHAMGWVTDPYAGTTAGSIYMQVVPTATSFKFPANTIVDSLVLALPYAGFTWGDTAMTATRTINVYSIAEGFSKDSTFYNFSRKSTESTPIGTATLQTGRKKTGSIQDSVSVLGINRAPHLRIRLSSAFRDNKFIPALPSDTSFATFTAQLPGFYLVPDTNSPGVSLPYFRLDASSGDIYGSAAVIAYAHTDGKTDTLVYQFPYDKRYAAHFNRITRNYSGTEAGRLLQSGDSTLAVMQNSPGAVIDVRLPFIQSLPKNLTNKSIIINKAELVFTKYPTISDDKFFGPARLYPQGINSSGGRYTIADFYTGNSLDFIDGTPHTAVKGGTGVTEYRINIPREVQKAIVQGSNGLHLRIGGTINFPAAYRLVTGGSGMPKSSIYRPSINIIYSKQ